MTVGTRGDMEPFLAVGGILQQQGHQVIYAFPAQFQSLIEDPDTSFFSLGTQFIDLLESDTGKAALGGRSSGLRKFWAYLKLTKKQTGSNKELIQRQYECVRTIQPDRIVYNGKAVYPIVWERDHPGQTILLSPLPYMHYTRDHTHVALNGNLGPWLNKCTYRVADFGMITTVRISMKWLHLHPKLPRKQIKQVLHATKAIYTISPAIYPRPDYWDARIQVVGFHTRDRDQRWQPTPELQQFLAQHDRLLFLTFGSMGNPAPAEKTQLLVDILERHHIPAVINTASEGLVPPNSYDTTLIHFVADIPYRWIFPKMYGVIHHGGSGTTQLALQYGCASLVIPHIIDQFVWNDLVANLGAGPKGVRINKITEENLEPKILDLFNNPSYKNTAEEIARQMQSEDLRAEVVNMIAG